MRQITDDIVYKALNTYHAVRFASMSSDARKVRREAMRAALATAFQHAQPELRRALQTALVAMKLASALPGVSDEYDFSDAIRAVEDALFTKGQTDG
ncbi:MAG TPA: hypothetical protein VGN93_31175 [Shinella sp.]|jgi:hypothetical protein|uniref:hypothetical protein n=1 Tax=Shinella sp. TaxID=1870904 RepID=UPI002E12C70D|nr:hypothetical protein [Shinella sp.]